MLVDFTGSDWCGWCIKLDKEVFSTPEFREYAAEKLVLLEIDFPKCKPQDDQTKARNRAFMEKYGVKGFPTIFLLDHDGEVILKTGYRRGGPAPYVEHFEEAMAEK